MIGALSVKVGNDVRSMDLNDPDNKLYGQTLMSGIKGAPSPDNNVYIYTSLNNDPEKRATNIAHEAYGHAYLYELKKTDSSIDVLHQKGYIGTDPLTNALIYGDTNLMLQKQINKVESESKNNYKNNQRIK